eukprot:2962756-Alexandrium_andersonii.AAC.1
MRQLLVLVAPPFACLGSLCGAAGHLASCTATTASVGRLGGGCCRLTVAPHLRSVEPAATRR